MKNTFLTILFLIGMVLLAFSMYFCTRYSISIAFPHKPPQLNVDSWDLALAPIVYAFFLGISWLGASLILVNGFSLSYRHFCLRIGLTGLVHLICSLFNIILIVKMLNPLNALFLNPPDTLLGVAIVYVSALIFLSPGITLIIISFVKYRLHQAKDF